MKIKTRKWNAILQQVWALLYIGLFAGGKKEKPTWKFLKGQKFFWSNTYKVQGVEAANTIEIRQGLPW